MRLHADTLIGTYNDGDSILSWPDSITAGSLFSAAGAGKPVFKTSIVNGHAVARFTAAQGLYNATNPINIAFPYTAFFVLDSTSAGNRALGARSSSNLFVGPYSSFWSFFSGGGSIIAGPAVVSSKFVIAAIGMNSSNHSFYVNNTTVYEATAGGTAIGTLALGVDIAPGTDSFVGDIAEVLIYNAELNAANRLGATLYLADRYAIRVPGDPPANAGAIGTVVGASRVRYFNSAVAPGENYLTADSGGRLHHVDAGSAGVFNAGISKSPTEGSLSAPSLVMDRAQVFSVRWPVVSGSANTFSIKVKQPGCSTLPPRIVAKADASLGVNSDVVGTAAVGTGWLTIGPISVTPSVSGVIEVQLESRADCDFPALCYWDSISVTPAVTATDFAYWKEEAPVLNFGGNPGQPVGEAAFSFVL
jgi:hypothetical protein